MNFSALNIILTLVVILAIPYVISIVKKTSNGIPFLKALNPSYNVERYEADELKKSLKPITDEMQTLSIAKFMKHWSDKFEQNRLSVEDVKELNAKISNGATAQVNGILSLHPAAKAKFNEINAQLILEEEAKIAAEAAALAAAEVKEEAEVLA